MPCLRRRTRAGARHPGRGGQLTVRLKLDENLSPEYIPVLAGAGYEVTTVAEEGLAGKADERVAEVCRRDGKVLLTADRGFGHIIEYPPAKYGGIIVLRAPKPSIEVFRGLVEQVASALRNESPVGCIWIVEPGRIRVQGGRDGGKSQGLDVDLTK